MYQHIAHGLSCAVAFVLGHTQVQHTVPTACGAYNDVEYCYYAGDARSNHVVYSLHGFGHDKTAWGWNPSAKDIQEEWARTGSPRPVVVTLSIEGYWWYNRPEFGFRLKNLITWLETTRLSLPSPARSLYGDSMGAHNALRWASDSPELFERLLLTCPAIPAHSVWAVSDGTGLPVLEKAAAFLISSYYAAPQFPSDGYIGVALKSLPSKVHMVVSNHDEFGFRPGGLALYELIRAKELAQVSLEQQNIRHCDVEANRLAKFLIGDP